MINKELLRRLLVDVINYYYEAEFMANIMSNDRKVDIEYTLYCNQVHNSNRTKTIKKLKIKAIQKQMLENYICDLFDYCHKVIIIKNKCISKVIKIEPIIIAKKVFLISSKDKLLLKKTLSELIKNSNKNTIKNYQLWLFKNYKGVDMFYSKLARDFYIDNNKFPYNIT